MAQVGTLHSWRTGTTARSALDPLLWGGYLGTLVLAEVLIAIGWPWVGVGLHLALVLAVPLYAALAPGAQRGFWIALSLPPLVRIVSLVLPTGGLAPFTWYAVASLPLFAAVVPAIRVLGLSRRDLGLRVGNPFLQLAIGLLGIPLGVAIYLVLRPALLVADLSWPAVLVPATALLISIGFLEELIFRGVLQATVGPAMRRGGLLYVSSLFAALHIGHLSPLYVALMLGVGIACAWLVARTGSILGVSLAHGVANIALYLVLPQLASSSGSVAGLSVMLTPAVATNASLGLAAPLGGIVTLVLLALLVQRELADAAVGRLALLARLATVPIVALLVTFGAIVIGRLTAAL